MTPTKVSPDFSVTPQMRPEEVAEAAALGFKTIISNRPEGEVADQPATEAIRAEAERLGLTFVHLPVVSGAITQANVDDFAAALDRVPGPVLAYCRSGGRSKQLWQLAQG